MEDMSFTVRGSCRIDNAWKPFTKVVSAPNERIAVERAYTLFGSNHRLKRDYIRVDSVTVSDGE